MSTIRGRLAALEARNFDDEVRPALVQIISEDGPMPEQVVAADLVEKNGTQIVKLVCKDMRRPA